MVCYLIKNGADINCKNNLLKTEFVPLLIACQDNKMNIVKLLLTHGALTDDAMFTQVTNE